MANKVVLEVLEPTGVDMAERNLPAPRPDTLDGKMIGLVWNEKANANVLLEEVGKLLLERYPTAKISSFQVGCCWPAPKDVLKKIADEVDAAVFASAD